MVKHMVHFVTLNPKNTIFNIEMKILDIFSIFKKSQNWLNNINFNVIYEKKI